MYDKQRSRLPLGSWLRSLAADLRYAIRQLTARPGFTLTAVLSLALGIGANTAIFSIVNAVLLRSLPVEDPDKLVQLRIGNAGSFTNAMWEQVRDHQQIFSGTLAYAADELDLADGGERQFAQGIRVSGDFFHVLGVSAIKGRVFSADDDRRGLGSKCAVAVISHQFWQHHFAGDENVIGKTIRLNRQTFQVIGVTPAWFTGLEVDHHFDVAIPLACEPLVHTGSVALDFPHVWWLRILGRVPADKSMQQTEGGMKVLSPQVLEAATPKDSSEEGRKDLLSRPITIAPASTGFSNTGDEYRTALLTLMATVSLVLLIACANIANLLLARATARQKEISVRMAIGASRLRLIRQLMTESLLLALVGAAAGLLLAEWGSRLLVGMLATSGRSLDFDLSIDTRVFAFTLGATLLTALLFGLIPAIRATRIDINAMLKENARGSTQGRSRFTAGQLLMVGQVGLSLILLVGAGLFIGTLRNLLHVNPGFESHNVLIVTADIEQSRIDKARRAGIYRDMAQHFQAIAGIESVSSSWKVSASGMVWDNFVYPQGSAAAIKGESVVYFNRVSPGFFRTMKTPLLTGREFSENDKLNAPLVMILDEVAAHQLFGQANAVGQLVGMRQGGARGPDGPKDMYEVIGVTREIKYEHLDEKPHPIAYLSTLQNVSPDNQMRFELRTTTPPAEIIPAVRTTVSQIDPAVSLQFANFETQMNQLLQQPKIMAVLSTIFGVLAALLAMIGLYGTTSYAVAQRRSEIGIRMALGAQRHNVLKLIVRQGMMPAVLGIIVGIIGAMGLTRIVESLLFGVHPADPITFIAMSLLMGIVALVACALPARSASMIDPMIALRND